MKKGRGRQSKGGSCLIKFVNDLVSHNRGLLRLFRKEISKNKRLRQDIEVYLNSKFNCGLDFLDELCNGERDMGQFRSESERARQRHINNPEHNLRNEINLPSEVYINNFIYNLCYRYEKYYKQLFLLSETFYEIFCMADLGTVL
jgi:hypothetical protein